MLDTESQSRDSQLASTVLMIRPRRFQSNPLTAPSNAFQGRSRLSTAEQQSAALEEFEALAAALRGAGINVIVIEDTDQPHTPDAIFPNNWVSFHADGRAVLYPMEAENRRTERRADILERMGSEFGFRLAEVVDLSGHEDSSHYLEGTGSLVLDRVNRIAYACLSSRTHLDPLGDFAQRMDYDVVAFDAVDRHGQPIYHTNVLMSVGEDVAIVCDEAIRDADQRRAVLEQLQKTNHEVVSLSFEQMEAFAGNMLALENKDGESVIVMSQSAFDSLDEAQLTLLQQSRSVLSVPISTIEASAGGSVRCMLAEVHLPP